MVVVVIFILFKTNYIRIISRYENWKHSNFLHSTVLQCIYICLQLGMHYIPLIDPGVSGSEKPGTYPPYDEGLEMDIFIKNSTGLPFVGKVSLPAWILIT